MKTIITLLIIAGINATLSAQIKEPQLGELHLELIQKQNQFISLYKNEQYDSAQFYLHPDGVYLFNLGKIPHYMFEDKYLSQIAHPLLSWDGMYNEVVLDSNGDTSEYMPPIVNGTFWMDSLVQNFDQHTPKMYDYYQVMGYGFSGTYSSDHINLEMIFDHPDSFKGKETKILYTYHNTLMSFEVLMTEFFQDGQGNWKIYAFGELYWTP